MLYNYYQFCQIKLRLNYQFCQIKLSLNCYYKMDFQQLMNGLVFDRIFVYNVMNSDRQYLEYGVKEAPSLFSHVYEGTDVHTQGSRTEILNDFRKYGFVHTVVINDEVKNALKQLDIEIGPFIRSPNDIKHIRMENNNLQIITYENLAQWIPTDDKKIKRSHLQKYSKSIGYYTNISNDALCVLHANTIKIGDSGFEMYESFTPKPV